VIRAEGNENIIIHQCPSGYPARIESINLKIIKTLKAMFPFPIAYSDHTPGWEMDVAAVALGANLVEKTISFDRTTRSIEHIFSLEPNEMSDFVRVIRDLETAMGRARRVLAPAEKERRASVRRSIHLRAELPAGHELDWPDLDYRRPGDGIPPTAADTVVGQRLTVAKAAGDRLAWSDLEA
jgi:sialic acid synthase SpsE